MPIPPSPPTKLNVYDGGSLVASRRGLNFSGLTLADDSGNNRVDVTLPTGAGCRVYHNTTQSIADTTATALAFNSERDDTDAYHDTSTNNSRLTVPSGKAGRYIIAGSVEFAANAVGLRKVAIRLNGTTIIAQQDDTALASGATVVAVETTYNLAVSDYVELVVTQTSTGSLNVNSSANYSPEFGMLLTAASASGGGSSVTVTEEDASPSVTATQIKFPSGSVTDNGGGSASVAFPLVAHAIPGSHTFSSLTDGQAFRATGSTAAAFETEYTTLGFVIDGGGSAIMTGSKGFLISDFAGVIENATLLADQSGSIVIDVKKSTYSGFPSTSSIAASAKPTLSSAQKSQDATLTGWTTTIAAGDVLEFVVDSASTVTRVGIYLKVRRT